MMHNLTNLLPEERAAELRGLYFIRLGVVAALLLAGVAIVHAVLLLPSYLLANSLEHERSQALAALASSARTDESEPSARAFRLAGDASYLARLGSLPKSSTAVAAIAALPHDGIRLVGFAFMPTDTGASMNLVGTADTRDALRRYEALVASAPFVESVDLPISAYAKETDIDFTMTLKGPFLP